MAQPPRTPIRPSSRDVDNSTIISTPSGLSLKRPVTPLRSGSPVVQGGTRVGGAAAARLGSGTSASPQVKAALAALRSKNRQPKDGSTCSAASSASSAALKQYDAFSTPPPKRSTHEGDDFVQGFAYGTQTIAVPVPVASGGGRDGGDGQDEQDLEEQEVVLDWGSGARSTKDLVEGAKKTCTLTLASRELKSVPSMVYESLMSNASIYHPSRQRKRSIANGKGRAAIVNFESSYEEHGTSWFEQRELRSLSMANNEIEEIEETLGGFEELEQLDVHNNYLIRLPSSLGHLTNLTSLNLSANKLDEFPIQILNLNSLVSLNLASNQLTHLWPVDWRVHLSDTLKPPSLTPTATPDSPEDVGGSALGFWTPAPSKPTRARPSEVEMTRAPFPRLTELVLSDNPFTEDVFSIEGWSLPNKLQELHVADTGLVETAFKAEVFGRLERLEVLDLAGSNILHSPFPSSIDSKGNDDEALFPQLSKLDVSRNSIDSLEHLEAFFVRRVRRPVEYVGLEKPIVNLIKAAGPPIGLSGSLVRVVLHENPMRNEQLRRRATFSKAASTTSTENSSSGSTSSTKAMPEVPSMPKTSWEGGGGVKERRKEQWEIDAENGLLTEGGRRRARIEAARRVQEDERAVFEAGPPPKPSTKDTSEGITASLFGLDLKEAETKEISEAEVEKVVAPPEDTPISVAAPTLATSNDDRAEAKEDDPAIILVGSAMSGSSIDLSSRSLSTLPSPLASPPLKLTSPTSLSLARNAITSIPVLSLSTWGWTSSLRSLDLSHNGLTSLPSSNDITLPNLSTLNLSHNSFASLVSLSTLAPNLTSLDLSRNRLTSDEGISLLLLPSTSGHDGGLVHLNLSGNKFSSLPSLLSICNTLQGDSSLARSKGWRLKTLDLRDNEIGRLDPLLGWLPLDLELWLAGNTFRIPRREVYDHAQGARDIVGWLRERI